MWSGRSLWPAVALAAITACGRVAFEAHGPDGGDATTDAMPLPARSIVASNVHTCAVADGVLRCWGRNDAGQLGTGDIQGRTTATIIAPGVQWQAVTAGVLHTCALSVDGDVWCWGDNAYGQLGQGDRTARLTPTRVLLPAPALTVESWDTSTCALLSERSIYCWGNNAEGQLGLADNVGAPDALVPVSVASSERWIQVAPGEGHLLALAKTGVRWGAGRNVFSELGLGYTNPPQIRTLTAAADGPWRTLAGGQNHSCAIDAAGLLYCWGDGTSGQLGTGAQVSTIVPTQISAEPIWTIVDTHTFVGCAVSEAGALACWGRNVEGQLGTGDTTIRLSPTVVTAFSDWVAVSVGHFHTCAMRADGSAWCTGDNSDGVLGTGDTMRRNALTRVTF